MDGRGERKICEDGTKRVAEGVYYPREFHEDKQVECPVSKNRELTAKEMAGWETLSKKATSFDEAQRKRTAEFERRVIISEGQPTIPETAPIKNRSRKREERESGSERTGKTSSRKVSRPRVNTRQEIQSVEPV